jgi:hypothetical protein
MLCRPQKVVMIVPIDANEGKAEDVYEQFRQPVAQGREASATGRPETQRSDGDDHRHHPVTERF